MIMSKKNSSDTVGNRTRYLPACSAVSNNNNNNNNNNILSSFLIELETIYRLTPGCLGGSLSPLGAYDIYKYFFPPF